ncbi:hypothetical protein MUA30_14120 (plasmid) [Staphylococcus aureus]|nr:hypothetical protein [Staphylococcus aureus]UXT31801.1 hypothetical protein MUA67_13995 [Staphylococcus aureus]UXU16777.1 hypothetical protein MUA30_14120 [Staphylococcus aureus]
MYNVMNTDSDNKIKVNELSLNVLKSAKVGISKKLMMILLKKSELYCIS